MGEKSIKWNGKEKKNSDKENKIKSDSAYSHFCFLGRKKSFLKILFKDSY